MPRCNYGISAHEIICGNVLTHISNGYNNLPLCVGKTKLTVDSIKLSVSFSSSCAVYHIIFIINFTRFAMQGKTFVINQNHIF